MKSRNTTLKWCVMCAVGFLLVVSHGRLVAAHEQTQPRVRKKNEKWKFCQMGNVRFMDGTRMGNWMENGSSMNRAVFYE